MRIEWLLRMTKFDELPLGNVFVYRCFGGMVLPVDVVSESHRFRYALSDAAGKTW